MCRRWPKNGATICWQESLQLQTFLKRMRGHSLGSMTHIIVRQCIYKSVPRRSWASNTWAPSQWDWNREPYKRFQTPCWLWWANKATIAWLHSKRGADAIAWTTSFQLPAFKRGLHWHACARARDCTACLCCSLWPWSPCSASGCSLCLRKEHQGSWKPSASFVLQHGKQNTPQPPPRWACQVLQTLWRLKAQKDW